MIKGEANTTIIKRIPRVPSLFGSGKIIDKIALPNKIYTIIPIITKIPLKFENFVSLILPFWTALVYFSPYNVIIQTNMYANKGVNKTIKINLVNDGKLLL